ncbi:LysR family transcriptional regulator [Thalassospira sp.]|uniref:LysR family transcriptional regulator n=1 Tax=Thalassospira sp. TaxID=1912094 RepID=UPI00273543EE|nr:LysR family transcriptional regulator [Thalassospira sp.]MDP2697366.1 LysR family transcriptional regulator [Thalassospira sp.]
MRIDDKPLRYFLAVYEAGSIRTAAEHLRIAPSAISRQIAALEDHLQTLLMERTKRGIVFTGSGHMVAAHARRRIELDESFGVELAAASGAVAGTVRIATGEGFVVDLVNHAVKPLRTEFPDIRLTIAVAGTEKMTAGILHDDYDIGLVFNPPRNPDLELLAEDHAPLCALVPPHFDLARKSSCCLADTLPYPGAILNPHFGVSKLLAKVDHGNRLCRDAFLTADSINVAVHFVLSGCGITYLPAFAVSRQLRRGEVVAVPLTDPFLADVPSHLLVRKGRPKTAAVRAVTAMIRDRMEAFGSAQYPDTLS